MGEGRKKDNGDVQSGADGSRPWRGVTDDMVAEALVKSAGIIYKAAMMVGLHRHAVERRISKSARLRRVQQEIVEKVLDMAEAHLFSLVAKGNMDAIRFILNNKGRSRGYGNRVDIGLARDAEPVRIIDDITVVDVEPEGICGTSDSEA